MKKFDDQEFLAKYFLGITSENFRPIYLPIIISLVVLALGALIYSLIGNETFFRVTFGITQIILALSGLGQIRRKEVPGFPYLRGGCAVIFGAVFLAFFVLLGIGVILFE